MNRFIVFLSLSILGFARSISAVAAVPNPNCPEIGRAYVLFASDTSMQFVIEGMSDSVQVEYGLSGFTQGTGTFLITAEDTFTIGGLQSDTTYQFYFQNNCKGSGNGVSGWSDTFAFSTAIRLGLPYTNDFDNGWGKFRNTFYTDSLDPNYLSFKLRWKNTNTAFYQIGFFMHAGGSNFALLQSFPSSVQGATHREAYLMTPIFDTAGMKEELIMEWNEHRGGLYGFIQVFDGVQWQNISPLQTGGAPNWRVILNQGLGVGTPHYRSYDITQYANPNLKIRIGDVNPSIGFEPFLVIDDFRIRTVDCRESSDFKVLDAGANWVKMKWVKSTAAGHRVEYGPAGFTPGTGTSLYTTNDTISINNLNPNTNYEFLLTDSCSNGVWLTQHVQSTSFTTADSIQNMGYFADFQMGQSGFTILDNTPLGAGWYRPSSRMAVSNPGWYEGFSSDEYLIAPQVFAGSRPAGSSITIEYDLMHVQIIFPLKYSKLYLEHYNGSTWQTLATYQGSIFDLVNSQTVPKSFSLNVTNISQAMIQLRFRAHFDDDHLARGWAVDNVRIQGNCGSTVSSFDTVNVGKDSASLSWSTNGSMVNLKWGPPGFNPDTLGGTVLRGLTGNSHVISSLLPGNCYDVYIQDTCSNFGQDAWTSLLSFCTDVPYCPELERVELLFASDTSLQFAVIGMSDSVRIEYGLSGFVQGGGTFLKTDQDTFTVGGLLSDSTYDFYFENNCKSSGNGISSPSGVYSFETAQIVSLPYTNNFDSSLREFKNHYFTNAQPGGQILRWERIGSVPLNTIPGAFYHANGTTFARLLSLVGQTVGATYREAVMTSPILDTSGMKEKLIMEWDEHHGGLSPDIQVYDGSHWTHITPFNNGSPSTWYYDLGSGVTGRGMPSHKIYDITAYANPQLMIRWKSVNPPTLAEPFFVIDDFEVRHADCIESRDFRIEDAGPDWVHLQWNFVTAAGFKVEYGPVGFTPGSGSIVRTTSNTLQIDSLSPGTAYEFLLTDSCVNGTWLNQYTLSAAYTTADSLRNGPYYADFQTDWEGFSVLDNTPLTPGWQRSGGRVSVIDPDWYTGLSSDEYLIAPPVYTGSIPTGGSLKIEYGILQSSILNNQSSKVYVEMYNGTFWQSIQIHNGPVLVGTGQTTVSQTLSVSHINQPITRLRFRFHAEHTISVSQPWVIDDVRISGDCGSTTTNLDTAWVGKDNAAISWSNTGGMVNLSWGPSGYDPYQTGTVKRAITSLQDTIPGLSWNTCYDVYIADTCSGFIQGDWIGPLSFCTDSSLCPTPSQVQLNFVGTDSAYFSWTSSGGLLSTTLEYGPAGFARGSGTVFYTTGGNAGIGSLSSLTTYDVYIQDSCLANDLSFWAKLSFTTLDTPMVAPFFQNFDSVPSPPVAYHPLNFTAGTDYFPESWLNYSADGKLWEVDTSVVGGPANDHTTGSGKYAFVDDGAQPNAMGVLMTTPLIDISALNWPSLQFYHWGSGLNSNLLHVDLWNGQQWLDDILIDSIGTNSTWKQGIVDLAAYPISGNIMIRFRVDEDSSSVLAQNSISIDDVSIDEMPICPLPIWPQETLSTCKSISLVGYDHPNIDSVLIEYGPAPFTPGSGTIVSLSESDTMTIGGLSINTTYDLYIANVCDVDSSSKIGPITITTDQDSSAATFSHNFNSLYGVTFTSTGHKPGDMLRWDFGDGNTDTGAVVTHSYGTGGAYTVRLIVSNECQTDTALLVLGNVGLDESREPIRTFELYPNPARDELTIIVDLKDRVATDVDIFDVNGRAVYHRTFEPSDSWEQKLNIRHWSRGVYSIRIQAGESVVQSKVTLH